MDNKSHDYTVVRLDHDPHSGWNILTPILVQKSATKAAEAVNLSAAPDDTGDVAFEHLKSGAIISLNSVCHEYHNTSLEELSKYLLLGLNTHGAVTTRDIEVDGAKALESSVDAAVNERHLSGETQEYPVRVRAVVLRKSGCTFDLLYIARPNVFNELLPNFDRFLRGFHAQ